jgi:hypothetical protein
MADAEIGVRVRQWARRLGGLSRDDRAIALSVLDGVVKGLCQSLGTRELRDEVTGTSTDRRRGHA